MSSKSLWLPSLIAVALGFSACGGDAGETPGESARNPAAGAPSLGAPGPAAVGGSTGMAQPSVAGSSAARVGAAGQAGMPAVIPPPAAGSGVAPSAGSGALGRPGPAAPAGSGAPAQVMNPDMCPPAPMGATPEAVAALAAVNNYRVPAGAGCATMVAEINAAASAHCKYYDMYMEGDMCIASPHMEVMSCAGFTGENPGTRMRVAGYMASGGGGGEVMAFVNNPQSAVDTWMNSVWHRTPIIDPWTTHLGYGNASSCDTIDFGRGTTPAPADTVVVYPYDGQLNVPVSFNGQYEGPMPPAPATGWPSSGPISISARGVMLTEHVLTKDGDATPIEHVWLDAQADIVEADMRRSLTNVSFMYANMPFTPNTKYRVKVSGTYMAGALAREWVFTTGAAATWPRR